METLMKIIGLVVSGYSFYLGYQLRRKTKWLKKSGISAEANVIELKSVGDHEQPVVHFTTLKGEVIKKEYEIGFNQGMLKQGQSVTVYYNENNPSVLILETGTQKWLPIIFMAAGLLIFAVLLFSLITGKSSWS